MMSLGGRPNKLVKLLPLPQERDKLGEYLIPLWEDALIKLAALIVSLYTFSFSLMAADAAKGEKLYKSQANNCIKCHGADGRGNPAEEAPRIAGQYDWYIISSVKQFQAGVERKNPKMLPYIKNLSDSDIADIAAYVSKLP